MAEEARYYTTTPKYSKKVLKPGDADYEKCRRMNPTAHKLDRYPQEIHVAETPADVAKALGRAHELGVCAGVRSSGHIFHVPSLIQDGILIDCANLNREIGYDPITQEVSFGPASRVEELAAKLKEVNRFFPHGHAPTVGSAGFMLAGGQGWFFRGWGATNQNWLTKIEMVLPDGRCVVASRKEYQDLWWAARGSGQAFFAVITRFWGKTIQRSNMWEKMLKFEINQENYMDLMTWAINAGYDTPKYGTDLNITIDYREKYDPQYTTEAIPPNAKLHLTLNLQCYCETQREARTLLSAYDRQPAHVQEFLLESRPVHPTSVETIFARKRQFLGNSSQEKWQINSIMNDKKVPLPIMLEKIRPCLLSLPTRTSSVFACHCDVEVDEEDACISLPQDLYISTITGWIDPKLEPEIMKPMREYYRNAFSVAVGQYITEFDINNEEANTKCISDTALAKFLAIREKYDPKGLFPTYKYFVKTHEKINRLQAQAKL